MQAQDKEELRASCFHPVTYCGSKPTNSVLLFFKEEEQFVKRKQTTLKNPPHTEIQDFFQRLFSFHLFPFCAEFFSLPIFLSLSTTQLNTKLSVVFFFPRHISQGSEKGVSLRSSSAFGGPSLAGCMVGEILRVKGALMCCGCFVPRTNLLLLFLTIFRAPGFLFQRLG